MTHKQLLTLFSLSFITMFVGSGLLPLLPIYASDLGAAPAAVGNYLAFVYFALALGTISAGWLSSKWQRRRGLLIATSLICTPTIYLMTQISHLWQLTALTSIIWFAGGAGLTLTGILAGLFADPDKRGQVFGLLALAPALGGLLGGLTTGPLVDGWGYPALFTVLSGCFLLQALIGTLLQDKQVLRPKSSSQLNAPRQRFDSTFSLLLMMNLFTGIAVFIGILGRSLAMDGLGFTASAITVTAALGAGAGLVFNPLIGWSSDRFDRKIILAVTLVGQSVALGLLATVTTLVGFGLAALLAAFAGAGATVSLALITDILPQHKLDRGMALFDGVKWAGGVVGFASTGYGMQLLGLPMTLGLGAVLPLIAMLLLAWIGKAVLGVTALTIKQ